MAAARLPEASPQLPAGRLAYIAVQPPAGPSFMEAASEANTPTRDSSPKSSGSHRPGMRRAASMPTKDSGTLGQAASRARSSTLAHRVASDWASSGEESPVRPSPPVKVLRRAYSDSKLDDLRSAGVTARTRGMTSGSGSPNEGHGDEIPEEREHASVIKHLDDVLMNQFGGLDVPDPATDPAAAAGQEALDAEALEELNLSRSSTYVRNELGQANATRCQRMVENKFFMGFFMLLTMFALFAPDIDQLVGTKQSKFVMGVITTFVCFFFAVEIVAQSLGKKNYAFRAYFWLDFVAMLSLIPDTWLLTYILYDVMDGGEFAAGRSTRLIRLASRSSRATRLNRLTRIVRVASLMPKIGALLGRRVNNDESDKLLNKKLKRVFMFLDEDMDGMITRPTAIGCLQKMRSDKPEKNSKREKMQSRVTDFAKKGVNYLRSSKSGKSTHSDISHPEHAPSHVEEPERSPPTIPTHAKSSPALLQRPPASGDASTERSPRASGDSSAGSAQKNRSSKIARFAMDEEPEPASPEDSRNVTPPKRQAGEEGSPKAGDEAKGCVVDHKSPKKKAKHAVVGGLEDAPTTPTSEVAIAHKTSRNSKKGGTLIPNFRWARGNTTQLDVAVVDDEDEFELVNYDQFKSMLMEDEWVGVRLRQACQKQLREGNTTRNLTSRHSEYVAVKVALGTICLLFVLGAIEPVKEDLSGQKGLNQLSRTVDYKFPEAFAGDEIPVLVQEGVAAWKDGRTPFQPRDLIYLDIGKRIYCNMLVTGRGQDCITPLELQPEFVWGERTDLEDILKFDIRASDIRSKDIEALQVPSLEWINAEMESGRILDGDVHNTTISLALINVRGKIQEEAAKAIATTVIVIFIICLGIALLTKDLTFLSRNLLTPLRELADDMESIAQLQLAGVSSTEDGYVHDGTSEVRLIRRTFENMKKAIKSWGKYVPWPVVQLLLRANVEANLEVNESEVSIFFSDIAGFTTIVENLPPEQSLLLLSRYFNDMSKVIDDHGGVVLEFIGDAILCIYGAPLLNPDHPTAAVKASLRMLAMLKKMNEWAKNKSLPTVGVRCGVHTGTVLVGNMGFASRMKYGIVGEDASIPATLEETNKNYGTNLLISQNTFDQLEPGAFVTRPVDYIHLRGKSAEICYQVLDREKKQHKQNPLWPGASVYSEALDCYRDRDFEQASALFQRSGELLKKAMKVDDDASALMIRRCRVYSQVPPSPEWNGVWDRGELP